MKMMKNIALIMLFIGIVNISYAGVIIGADAFFTTSFINDVTNDVNPSGVNSWVGKNTTLFLGLYPILKADGINGWARIFVNSESYNNIYFGGANVAAFTKDKNFTARLFTMSAGLAMSDPMATGVAYGSDVSGSVITLPTHFLNGTNVYPVTYDTSWMYGEDTYLGGHRGSGVYTMLKMLDSQLQLEDFACWSMNNYDTYGAMLKLNPLSFGDMFGISAGVTAETIKYKSKQDFNSYNAYYFTDPLKYLPAQSTAASLNNDAYLAYGGYVDAKLFEMLDVFGQIKLTHLRGDVSNPDNTKSLGGMSLYAGAFASLWGNAMMFEGDFSLVTMSTNSTNTTIGGSRNIMTAKVKAYGDLDFEVNGMTLKYLVEGTYINFKDNISGMKQYEFVSFGSTPFTNASGIDVKASAKFSFFWMFDLREMARFSAMNMTAPGTYGLTQIESRTYLDIDLEDVTAGLWATAGLRVNVYNVSASDTAFSTGSATYLLPYAEVKYVFGEDSFVRVSFGYGEFFGVLAQAYGIGYDAIQFANSAFNTTAGGDLMNEADYAMQKNASINLQFGYKL